MPRDVVRRFVMVTVIAAWSSQLSALLVQTPVATGFTYQGRLTDGDAPARGPYDFEFTLYDALKDGTQVGSRVTKDDVDVTNGLFTVILDFGAVFSGSKRWLQIGVRPAASAGEYVVLKPRQELAPAPDSISLAGQNGAFYLDLLTHTGTLGVAQGGTGGTSVAAARTNLGVAKSGANSDITSLTGLSVPLSIAQGGTGGGTASAALTALGAQARIVGTCLPGTSLHAINNDGSTSCHIEAPRSSRTLTRFESAALDGEYTSITIGADGLGLVSYHDFTSGHLKVAHCANRACSNFTALPATIASTGNAGGLQVIGVETFVPITIGADGLGLISYSEGGSLKVAHCVNTACSSATIATLDSGAPTSLTIGADGLGLISYAGNGGLKVAHCVDTACSSATTATLDSVGHYTSITIGADGLGLISYYDGLNTALKVAHCVDSACSSATLATLDSADNVGAHTSITIGADGLGLISYYDSTNADLKVAHCVDSACSSATIATLDSAGTVGAPSSITTGADGLGVISYYDGTNADLKVARCTNATCSSASIVTVDSVGGVGRASSITIGVDGFPLISYRDQTNDDLKVAHCVNVLCSAFVVRRR